MGKHGQGGGIMTKIISRLYGDRRARPAEVRQRADRDAELLATDHRPVYDKGRMVWPIRSRPKPTWMRRRRRSTKSPGQDRWGRCFRPGRVSAAGRGADHPRRGRRDGGRRHGRPRRGGLCQGRAGAFLELAPARSPQAPDTQPRAGQHDLSHGQLAHSADQPAQADDGRSIMRRTPTWPTNPSAILSRMRSATGASRSIS
jgi:hypothetical protein